MTNEIKSYIDTTARAIVAEIKLTLNEQTRQAVNECYKRCLAERMAADKADRNPPAGTEAERLVKTVFKNWKSIVAAVLIAVSLWRSSGKITPEEIQKIITQVQCQEISK